MRYVIIVLMMALPLSGYGSSDVLTRDEAIYCRDRGLALVEEDRKLKSKSAELERAARNLERQNNTLKTERFNLDSKKGLAQNCYQNCSYHQHNYEMARIEFNNKVRALKRKMRAHDRKAEIQKKRLNRLRRLKNKFNKRCGGQQVREKVVDDVCDGSGSPFCEAFR